MTNKSGVLSARGHRGHLGDINGTCPGTDRDTPPIGGCLSLPHPVSGEGNHAFAEAYPGGCEGVARRAVTAEHLPRTNYYPGPYHQALAALSNVRSTVDAAIGKWPEPRQWPAAEDFDEVVGDCGGGEGM